MSSDRRAGNAVSGKTARPCDSCMRKRARWYCTADDAFLCQACDGSVHSANSLARRHERVRLKTASYKPSNDDDRSKAIANNNSPPAWHQGFRRKARTPRKPMSSTLQPLKTEEHVFNPLPLVPEMGNDETSRDDESEEQLLYRVPIFDPFLAEFCSPGGLNKIESATTDTTSAATVGSQQKINHVPVDCGNETTMDFGNIPGLLPSEMDLADFAADVETLLGRGLDEDSFGMEGLGLMDTKEEDITDCCFGRGSVKMEKEEEHDEKEIFVEYHVDLDLDMSRETLDLNFDYDSPTTGEEEEVVTDTGIMMMSNGYNNKTEEITSAISLRLNYDAVMAAWSTQGSPWTTGDRSQLNRDDCWPDCSGTYPADMQSSYGDVGGIGGGYMGVGDGGREARVSRYREKRRTRLFSKKIRYEVRKLNAEKRPRMKGRFVKRTSFGGAPVFPF
ncbi:hypothetical protein GIB67_012624 [Kingdonia uniflora]|uniref:Uncharacterized protein n=1 Tax=Kingdonia uniflora TaxID=39325 RepID=A0A7J7NEZ3_9MAGN|nr:hypothetical protein GIB67_012624 [Kingdonia uniflora]